MLSGEAMKRGLFAAAAEVGGGLEAMMGFEERASRQEGGFPGPGLPFVVLN